VSAAHSPSVEHEVQAALQRRDPQAALAALAREAAEPGAKHFLDKALALRMLGDLQAAVAALDSALALEPLNFIALLSKGALLERLGQAKAAAVVYGNALAIAPTDLPGSLAQPVERARQVVAAHRAALAAHLQSRVGALRAGAGAEALARFDESLEIFTGRARPFVQQPLLLHYPRLPAIPFYDRSHFPWLGDLEAATGMIQEELAAVMAAHRGDFAPYIAYPPGAPVNQWGELNHSRLWSTFFLWKDGRRQDDACALCPRTAALLESLPMQHQRDFAPTAMFSALEAHTRIPAHTGSANTRLIVHLPLVLPGPARFRVGNETRDWKLGGAWVFDDTIEHEAWNDADELRVILIFDVWNPFLSEAERELVSAMMSAKNEFQTT
jgi:aspartyl/asparaginyl beta-hydroxylase (cupin superfamily)